MKEVWRDIKGYEDQFSISNKGQVVCKSWESRTLSDDIIEKIFKKSLSEIIKETFPQRGRTPKEIHVFDSNGNFITTYESAKQAAKHEKFSAHNIRQAAKRETPSNNGKIYLYDKAHIKKVLKNFPTIRKKKKIYVFDIKGNYLCSYKNVSAAAKAYGRKDTLISSCAKGNRNQVGDLIFLWDKKEIKERLSYLI